jgi:DNA topoisomerase-3
VDGEEWKLKVNSVGWNQEATSDQPEYDVNPEPLGRCPFDEDCGIVESPTQFVCERKLKEAELTKEERKQRKEAGEAQSCGFVFPRTVCKREITRDEALYYLKEGRTELLTDFTSRFGRPFSATLVLKENGRHGFEFPPRKAKGAGDAAETDGKAPRKKVTRKKTAGKKKTKKKASGKKKAGKKATRKKATRKKATRAKKARKSPAAAAQGEDAPPPDAD